MIGKAARPADRFRALTTLLALAAPLLVITLVGVLARQAWPAAVRYGPGFLAGRSWNPVELDFGALPFVYGTLASSALALAAALPVGVGAALFLAEPAAPRLRGAIGVGVELLAAIPSVVYGLWGLYVLAPFLLRFVAAPVSERLGEVPVLAGPARLTSLFAASTVLAVMVLPTLAAVSRDVVRAVPAELREASTALGTTWWETTWHVVLPAARQGVAGAAVLALGRALGETIAVTMVVGNRPDLGPSVFAPAYTLASVIANEFTEATGPVYPAAIVELGLVLVLVTLAVNLLAMLLVRRAGTRAAS